MGASRRAAPAADGGYERVFVEATGKSAPQALVAHGLGAQVEAEGGVAVERQAGGPRSSWRREGALRRLVGHAADLAAAQGGERRVGVGEEAQLDAVEQQRRAALIFRARAAVGRVRNECRALGAEPVRAGRGRCPRAVG